MLRRPPLSWGFLLLTIVAACRREAPIEWHDEAGYRWHALDVPRRGRTGFTPMPPSTTRITFANAVREEDLVLNRHLLNGSGVALGDADGDGRTDVYLARIDGPNVLYRNLGNWRFEDVTTAARVGAPDRYSTGAVFADIDGDADLDLLVTAHGGPNVVFVNDGTGAFAERRLDDAAFDRGSNTMTLADVEGDGDLDLYVVNYKLRTIVDVHPPERIAFDSVVVPGPDGEPTLRPEFASDYVLRHQDTRVLRFETAEPDGFYLNDGAGNFTAVSFTDGTFRDEDGRPLTEAPRDWGLTARFQDIDDDGDPDLYVANDFESPDHLWFNDGNGRFQRAPPLTLRSTSHSSMAVDFADVDRDGDTDFLTVDMLSRDARRRRTQGPRLVPELAEIGVYDDRPQTERNTLFMNRGDATFAEVARYAGVAASEWSWGSMFLDVDLDGFEDILITTGNAYDVLDSDTQLRLRRRGRDPDWQRAILAFPPLRTPNVAFRNRGAFEFDDAGASWNWGFEDDVSHGFASGDLDGDGDLDLVVNRLDAPAGVLRNETPAPRLAVRLRGEPPNTAGIGAKIVVRGGPGGPQSKEVSMGGMYVSGPDPLYVFAAGDGDVTIDVRWRNGRRTTVNGAAADRLYEIFERNPAPAASESATVEDSTGTTFARVPLDHRHPERNYNDLGRQPLIPHRLSQLGPGVSWYDVDDDGDDDLLITGGAGGNLAYHRNEDGRFRRVPVRMPAPPLDQTTVLPVPQRGGGTALLLGYMNYEAVSPAAAQEADAVVRVEASVTGFRSGSLRPMDVGTAVPGARSSVGPMTLADYDGDGDLDLFVGGRVLPARFPLAASSRLLFNDGGTYRTDGGNAPTFTSVGMVSSAVFTDLDGDGDPDLVLATDGGPLRVLRNTNGRYADATETLGLASYVGRWNGVTTGDLNGDGRLDIVATNWGRNIPVQYDRIRPLRMFFGDLDNNGTFDVIEAVRDTVLDGWAPLASLPRLARALPFVTGRVSGFAGFANATVDTLFGPSLQNAGHIDLNTSDHMVFFNEGDRFVAHPLPWEAQLAPAFYAGVADFDGDGFDDVFLTQNFFANAVATDRYDAGRGLWLQGDGTGALRPVPGQVSGVEVYGDQRGAALADFDGDARVDLAVSQNGAETVVFRNQQGRPGIRVELSGPPGNPDGIGAAVRLVYADDRGPVREVHAGSGYWSHDGVVPVLGVRAEPTAVWVRWPGGRETETPVGPGQRAVVVEYPAGLVSRRR